MVKTLSRRRVDLCGVQEHRWAGSLAANQTCLIKGKVPPLNSSGVERKGIKAEPVFSWRKSGWTKFLCSLGSIHPLNREAWG